MSFKRLGVQMGIPEERMVPNAAKRPLSTFAFPPLAVGRRRLYAGHLPRGAPSP